MKTKWRLNVFGISGWQYSHENIEDWLNELGEVVDVKISTFTITESREQITFALVLARVVVDHEG